MMTHAFRTDFFAIAARKEGRKLWSDGNEKLNFDWIDLKQWRFRSRRIVSALIKVTCTSTHIRTEAKIIIIHETIVNTEIYNFGSKGRYTCNYVENEPMVKIKQFWVVIFVLAKKTAQDTSNHLEKQPMVKKKKKNRFGWLFPL